MGATATARNLSKLRGKKAVPFVTRIEYGVGPGKNMPDDKQSTATLHPPTFSVSSGQVQNANDLHTAKLTPLNKAAMYVTEKVGSMGFFLIILVWTVVWCGYNMIASEIPGLHWPAFDPFPAFVAYLLISNVIQILLMPLIMVGQNLQGQHSEIRAQLDFEINQKAEKEVTAILKHLEYNTDLIIQLMKHLECRISDEELRAIQAERELADKIANAPLDQA
jgi:uncharacterized membrane protein